MAKNFPSDFTDKILAKDRISFRRRAAAQARHPAGRHRLARRGRGAPRARRAVTKADAAWGALARQRRSSTSWSGRRPSERHRRTRTRRCGLRRRCEPRRDPRREARTPGSARDRRGSARLRKRRALRRLRHRAHFIASPATRPPARNRAGTRRDSSERGADENRGAAYRVSGLPVVILVGNRAGAAASAATRATIFGFGRCSHSG